MKKVYIYRGFERFWHWTQAALIFFLGFTGFEIHSSYSFFGFENAVFYHNIAARALIVLIIFAIFWHYVTGEWKQYLPTIQNLKAQAEYYLIGIFKNAPHPTQKTLLSKLNPLQRLVYFGLKVLILPLTVISGLFYLYYRYPQSGSILSIDMGNLENAAVLHTIGAFLLVAFLIVHLYLITTGHTVVSNLEAMITGYEVLEDEEEDVKENGENENSEVQSSNP